MACRPQLARDLQLCPELPHDFAHPQSLCPRPRLRYVEAPPAMKQTAETDSTTSRPAVNPLQARTFGIWTLTSAFIRLYASYHISNKP